jgi:diketogulonate reductase-like aldo/keto reductase
MSEPKQVKLNNGISMPSIGFGTWQIEEGAETTQAVAEALEAGYRLIDTAKLYGNEKSVGQAIRNSGIAREEIFVTTKLWNSDQGYESALQAFDDSLQRLGLDYIDLYLIHWPGGHDRHRSWQALEEVYESGRAKAVGVSNYAIEHLKQLSKMSDLVPAVNQVEFHPFIYYQQKELLKYCHQSNIMVEAYSPLARGRQDHPDIVKVANKHKKAPAQIMLRWALQHDTVPIPKSTHKNRMKENLEIFDFEIDAEDMKQLDSISTGERVTTDPAGIP